MSELREKQQEMDTFLLPNLNHDTSTIFAKGRFPEQTQPRRNFRWRLLTFIVLLAILLVLGGAFVVFANRKPDTTYQYQKVVPGDLSLTVSATGPLQGKVYGADFPVIGNLSEIDVKVGQTVQTGQTLATHLWDRQFQVLSRILQR